MKELFTAMLAAKGTKVAAFVMACLVALTGGGASGYYIYGATRPAAVEPVEIIEEAEVPEEDFSFEIYEEEEDPEALSNRIYLVSTSVEKDLKVSIVNDVGVTVTGYPFEIYVSKYDEKKDAGFLAEVTRQESLKDSEDEDLETLENNVELAGDKYIDDDEDGIIAIEKIDGGQYKVVLAPMEGFVCGGAIQLAEVKEKVEYKVVDVKNQIKKESQINAAIEDTSRKNVEDEGGVPDVSALLNTPKDENKTDEGGKDKSVVKVSKDEISSDVLKAVAPTVSVSNGQAVTLTKKVTTPKTNTPEPPATDNTTPTNDNTSPTTDNTTPTNDNTSPSNGAQGDDATNNNNDDGTTPESTQGASKYKKAALSLYRVGVRQESDAEADYTYYDAVVSLPGNLILYTNSTESGSNASTLALSISGDVEVVNQSSITWSVGDKNIATISGSGTSVTVTAVKDGTTTVKATVPYDDGTDSKTAEFSCTVEVKSVDLSKSLTDKDGNKLYLDEELTKEATLADLKETDKFYKEEKKEETPSAEVAVKSGSVGVDVSKWNGSINWKEVANSGVSFAVIRCGYRGSSTGALVQDPTFATNIKGAKAAGLKVGLYFFTQAVTEAEAVEEASMAVSMARSYGINMPIYIDTEAAGGRADGLSKTQRTACIKAFCKTVASAGYAPGVYASKCWYYDNLNAGELSGYNIWVAQYAAACNYSGRYNMWQYTSKGSVPGISGSVDMNIYY